MSLREPNVERLIAAFQKKKHDRVPNYEILVDPPMVNHVLGMGNEKTLDISNQSTSMWLEPMHAIEFAKKTHQDVITAVACTIPTNVEKIGKICSIEEVDELILPDVNTTVERVKKCTDAVAGTNIGVLLYTNGLFTNTYFTMGPIPIQSFMMNLYDNMPFVEKLMDTFLERQINILEAVRGLPISVVYLDDDVSSSTGYFASPKIMEQIWIPRMDRLMKVIKSFNVPVEFHCCGKLDPILPHLVRWGVDATHPVQPACNDIYKLKDKWGDRLCFIGNMSIEGVLAFGTPDEVKEDTRKHMEQLSYNGGYVVASSHSIIEKIPPENYFAMIEAAVLYGQF